MQILRQGNLSVTADPQDLPPLVLYWRCGFCRAEILERQSHFCGDENSQSQQRREESIRAPLLAKIAEFTKHFDEVDREIDEFEEMVEKVKERAEAAEREIERLEKLVYVPGACRCAKCGCQVQSTFIDAQSGRFSANNEPQQCPNGCGPMWKLTERDAGNQLVDRLEHAEKELDELRAKLEAARIGQKDPTDRADLGKLERSGK